MDSIVYQIMQCWQSNGFSLQEGYQRRPEVVAIKADLQDPRINKKLASSQSCADHGVSFLEEQVQAKNYVKY